MTRKLTTWLCALIIIGATPTHSYAANEGLTAEQVFQVLASEISLQRGEAGIAYQTYMSMARNSSDGKLAQRAMEIAIAANAPELALDAAKLWDQTNPKEAKEILITLFMLNQRWSESIKPAQDLLKSHKNTAAKEKLINSWRPLLARAQDEEASLLAFYQILSASISQIQDIDILYAFALGAEKIKHYDAMESTLRKIIAKKPNDKNALNALGYSYADRGIKLNEAVNLLTKAYQADTNDMYVLDSLAWANYRLGNKALAIKQLQQAFLNKPEAEIGAHLGEALWSTDDKAGADIVWRKAESIDANNKTLQEILARLWPNRIPGNNLKEKIWDGRFSVKVQGKDSNNGGSGSFTLTSESQTDILDIRNPIGGSMAKITINPSSAKLEDGDKVFEAHDADSLVQGYLGLPLPARGLSKWLSGQARTGAPASIERDKQYRTSKMIQDGWLMAFKWTEKNQLERMELKRNSPSGLIEIRLIFEPIDD